MVVSYTQPPYTNGSHTNGTHINGVHTNGVHTNGIHTSDNHPSVNENLAAKATRRNDGRFREFDLAGKVFIVSGGARGLGLSMAEALVEAGATGIHTSIGSHVVLYHGDCYQGYLFFFSNAHLYLLFFWS